MKVFYDLGIQNLLYWSCYFIGFVTIFIFNFFYASKYGLSKKKALLFTVVSYAGIYLWAYILAWFANGFRWGHHNAIRVFIWMPILMLLTCKLFKFDWKTSLDFITPSTCIVYGIARFGCFFPGCCYGVPASWGIYSYEAGHSCFPITEFEALTSLIIATIILIIAHKKNYPLNNGILYPIMLIMFGYTRYIWEFFSASERVLLNTTELGIWAFITGTIGLAWLLIVLLYRRKKKDTAIETVSE